MIGTAENSGGGISSVIRLMKKMPVWEKYACNWLGTQIQANVFLKLWYAVKATLSCPFIIPKYDIIHFHIVPGTTLFTQLPELLIAKLFGKRIIAEVHVGNQLLTNSDNKMFKWWLNKSDLVILLAKKWLDVYEEKYKDVTTPAQVLYNACDLQEVVPFEEKQPLIIFAGTIDDNKAPDILIKAWAKLKSKYPQWRVSILGNGNISYYEKMAADLGVSDCIEFTGFVTGNAKESLFRRASIYCMCSYVEGFPMVVLEAWAHNISVITTPVGGLPDVIDEGENCMTFAFGDVEELASNLDRLISDERLRRRIAIGGYNSAMEHFSLLKISDDLDRIYSNLLYDGKQNSRSSQFL